MSGAQGATNVIFAAIRLRIINAQSPAFAMIQMRGVPPSLPVRGRPPLTWTASKQLRGPFFVRANERSAVASADPLTPYGQQSGQDRRPDEQAEQPEGDGKRMLVLDD